MNNSDDIPSMPGEPYDEQPPGSGKTLRGSATQPPGRMHNGDEFLGRYTVLSELGVGGMGVVYKCLDREGGVEVAVKRLPHELGRNEAEMECIRENYAVVSRLSHPAISGLRQLAKDPQSGEYYLVMDLARGENLSAILCRRRGAPMPPDEALAILSQIASALDYVHGKKVLHRNIKPANVMVETPSAEASQPAAARIRVRLLDLGLVAEVHSTMTRVSPRGHAGLCGTPAYMAPEQWEARRQSAATDQYSLATVAYQMLSGSLPFHADNQDILRRAVLSRPPDPVAELPRAVNAALLRALAKNPAARFPSCMAFVEALARGFATRRRVWPWLLAGAAAVAAVAGIVVMAGGAGGTSEANGTGGEVAIVLPPASATLAELEDARAQLESRREELVLKGRAAGDPESRPVEEALATLRSRIDAALAAEARKAREAREAELADAEKELDGLAGECAAADASRLAPVALRKAERARKGAAAHRGGGRYDEAAAGYGTAKSLYGAALAEARAAKAAAEVESARSYKGAKLWQDCLAAASRALEWEPGNGEAMALKTEAQGAIDAERRAKEEAERKAREAEEAARREREAIAAAEKAELERVERERQELERREREADEPTRMLDAGAVKTVPVGGQALRLHWCPAGSFDMGSSSGEAGRYNDEMKHHVTLTRGFWIGETEVTQGLWKEVMGENPSSIPAGDSYPVENISWDMCQKFVEKLNARPEVKSAGLSFGMPTEAQWEYACRAGITGDDGYTGRLDDIGWYVDNSGSRTHPVGQMQANAWGLRDMHGNVWEWCADWYGDYYYSKSPALNPPGPATGGYRVLRGGCYWNSRLLCRSASRFRDTPFSGGRSYGLRLMAFQALK